MNTETLLTEEDLSKRFQLTRRTLISWRAEGKGPAHIIIGTNTVRYRMADVIAYETRKGIPSDEVK